MTNAEWLTLDTLQKRHLPVERDACVIPEPENHVDFVVARGSHIAG
jgi:hypothetical protein